MSTSSPDPQKTSVLTGPFTSVSGVCWSCELESIGDGPLMITGSTTVVFENGRPLPTPHANHDRIMTEGLGAYSHWGWNLYFSASDNSDPNTNGRTYSIGQRPRRPHFVEFGSCHGSYAVSDLERRGLITKIQHGGNHTHYTGETAQLIRYYRGEQVLPDALKPFCLYTPEPAILGSTVLDEADLVSLEICSPIEMSLGSYWLHRNRIDEEIIQPARKAGGRLAELAAQWGQNGMLRADDSARAEAAPELLALLPRGDERAEMAREIVRDARARRQDRAALRGGIAEIREMLGKPMVLVSHTLRYMPDGRPINWPPEFHRDLSEIATELGIPLIHPWKLVAALGAERSMEPDMQHYAAPLISALGDEMFARWREMAGADDGSSPSAPDALARARA